MADLTAEISTTPLAKPVKPSFLAIPPELRNLIYILYIGTDVVEYVPNWPVLSRHGCLPLVQTCKQIHQEFISLFIAKTTVRLRHFRLERYLQTFYPLKSDRAGGAAKLHLLLLDNDERPRTSVPNVDLTHLFKLMVQNESFDCTFSHSSESHELALNEAMELRDLLHNTSRSAASVLSSVISVQLVMSKSGWTNSKFPIVESDSERPAVWFKFKEHDTLPGEWPWYGALDLNHESLLLWQQWLEEHGAAGLQRWHVHVSAHRACHKSVNEPTIVRDDYRYTAVSTEKQSYDQMIAASRKCH